MKPAAMFRSALILTAIFAAIFISPIGSRLEEQESRAWLAWTDARVSQPTDVVELRERMHRKVSARLNTFYAISMTGMIGSFLATIGIIVVEGRRQKLSARTSHQL